MSARGGRASRADRIAWRDDLFDALVANPSGLTIEEIATLLVCTVPQARNAVHDLRLYLGEFDEINIPCRPQHKGELWVYTLDAGLSDATRIWMANRIGDSETRLRTMHAMMDSAVRATDGRSKEGQRARQIERGLRHLIENLDALGVP